MRDWHIAALAALAAISFAALLVVFDGGAYLAGEVSGRALAPFLLFGGALWLLHRRFRRPT